MDNDQIEKMRRELMLIAVEQTARSRALVDLRRYVEGLPTDAKLTKLDVLNRVEAINYRMVDARQAAVRLVDVHSNEIQSISKRLRSKNDPREVDFAWLAVYVSQGRWPDVRSTMGDIGADLLDELLPESIKEDLASVLGA